ISEKQDILNKIYSLQDGAIIGDGRSDFTQKTEFYNFKYGNQSFVLLDVPGIEGSEKKVIQQISNATQKAHAIFYVKKDCNPPQKGEEGKEGTIEKIQKQLDSQTEVYTIFNKPINNPRALKDELINANEKESLKILNEKMKTILGKHYMGHKTVSAQIAFYSLSQALIPETNFYKNQQKFLEIFKEEELLNKSDFKQLGKFISGELIENSRTKIIKSNYNKALKVIEKLKKAIKTTIDEHINPRIKEIREHQKETYYNLDYSAKKFVSNLENLAHKEIDQFKYNSREKMYAHIEKNIKNKEFQEIFKDELEQEIEKLSKKIEEQFKQNEEQFCKDIQKDIKQFEDRIKNSLENLKCISINNGFNLDIDIDSGINKIGLFASIGGLGLLAMTNFWNFAGWTILGLGIISGLIGIAKSIRKFFSSEYKKSEQRKIVNNNLNQICEEITEDMKNQLENGKEIIFENIENIKVDLNAPIDNYEHMKEQLKKADKNLEHIFNHIKKGVCNE
ncbi:TPA: GTPase, partial [Campylobacter jejuni]